MSESELKIFNVYFCVPILPHSKTLVFYLLNKNRLSIKRPKKPKVYMLLVGIYTYFTPLNRAFFVKYQIFILATFIFFFSFKLNKYLIKKNAIILNFIKNIRKKP